MNWFLYELDFKITNFLDRLQILFFSIFYSRCEIDQKNCEKSNLAHNGHVNQITS